MTRKLTEETIDKGTVKLADLYLISAIAYLPVFQMILHSGNTVNGCQIRHGITPLDKAKSETLMDITQRGLLIV
jgi:hypothetical protein